MLDKQHQPRDYGKAQHACQDELHVRGHACFIAKKTAASAEENGGRRAHQRAPDTPAKSYLFRASAGAARLEFRAPGCRVN
jgi:hypothetical protein